MCVWIVFSENNVKKPEEVLGELLRRGSARSRLLGLNNAKAEMREWIKTMSRKR